MDGFYFHRGLRPGSRSGRVSRSLDARELADAAGGRGQLVLVGGEAGVGKTTLIDAFREVSEARCRVLIGACDALSTPRPLGPLLDVARAVGGKLRAALEAGSRDTVFRTLLDELDASAPPTALVFEDAHHADDATIDLRRFVGRRIAGRRALVILTYRDDELGPRHPLRVLFGDLATCAVRRMVVPPLSQAAVAEMGSRAP